LASFLHRRAFAVAALRLLYPERKLYRGCAIGET